MTAALRNSGDAGHALPTVIPELAQLGAHLRMGELQMFASASGVGKSVVALHIALKAQVPTLYISADTGKHTMYTRMASMLTGESVNQVDRTIEEDPDYYIPAILERSKHIMWTFDTNPSIEDIRAEIESFAVLHGDYPHLICVDNLRNIYAEEDDTHAQQHACENLKTIAAATGSAVLTLHHTTGQYEDGNVVVPLSGLENKVSKFPALIITFSLGDYGDLKAAIVKNRYGPGPGSGKLRTYIPFSPSMMRVGV